MSDDGRGIPVDRREGRRRARSKYLHELHAGGKFGQGSYKTRGGLHGVGASVVNALSEWLVVEVSRDSKVYRQEFDRGVPRGPMQVVGESTENGTTTTFLADADIFDETVYDATTIVSRFREMAFLTRGLRITFTDERAGAEPPVEFHYEGGIKDYVSYINESKDAVHRHVVYFATGNDQGEVEVAMQWNTSYQESVFSFANNVNTHEGGSHLSGFRSALTSTINKYARDKGLLKEKEDNLEGEDVREGLAAVISVKLDDPQFEGQTKTKLGTRGSPVSVSTAVNQKSPGVLRGEPHRRPPDRQQGDLRPTRPSGGSQGPVNRRGASRRSSRCRCPASSQTARSRIRKSGGALHRRG